MSSDRQQVGGIADEAGGRLWDTYQAVLGSDAGLAEALIQLMAALETVNDLDLAVADVFAHALLGGRSGASPDDSMEENLLDANQRMGAALTAIGMALGLPTPTAACHWGAPEILAAIATLFDGRHKPINVRAAASRDGLGGELAADAGLGGDSDPS